VVTVERKREAIVFLRTKEVSERRSCQLILLARSTCQYRIKREPDKEFEAQVKELAFANPRYGYRRVHALLKRGGQTVNRKRVVRVWQKFDLQVPRSKKTRKRMREPQPVTPTATCPNEVWTYDFVFDRDAAGRRLKLLTLMDEFTREGLAIRVGRSFKAMQVKEVLAEVGAKRGFPQFMRSDNGSEFIAGIIKERRTISRRHILSRAARGKTAKVKVSTVSSGTNVCGWKSSATGAKRKSLPNSGANSITLSDRTPVWAIERLMSSARIGKSGKDY
jgi:putative transposase